MKSSSEEFYIGWEQKAPRSFAKASLRLTIVIGLIVLMVPVLLVLNQRGFADSVFEFGNISEVEGVLTLSPVPMLKSYEGDSLTSILLVGLGKMGARPTIEKIMEERGETLDGKKVKLRGSRIYHQGKIVLELTEGKKALVQATATDTPITIGKEELGSVTLKGEILDPKCALGVMKPGFGKPHRSCAIRCISGGIPPVMRLTYPRGETDYVLILGEKGEMINEQLLPYIADQILLCGQLEKQDDWYVLYTSLGTSIHRLLPNQATASTAQCGS